MWFKRAAVFLFSALIICMSALTVHAQDWSTLKVTDYVNDYVGLLSPAQKEQLNQLGRQLDKETGAQVVFVLIDSLDGQNIREVSLNIGENNKIGSERNDSGLVFLLAVDDRKYAMEVGTGLEGILPDIKTKHIMDDYLVPYLKRGEYAQGVSSLYKEVVDVIEANAEEVGTPADSKVQDYSYGYPSQNSSWLTDLIVLGVFGFILYAVYRFGFKPDKSSNQFQSIHLQVGQDFYLKSKDFDFKTDQIFISSRNPAIVSVKPDGWIHANRVGQTNITLQKNGEQRFDIPVTVGRSGYSNRRNDELLEGFLWGALMGNSFGRRHYGGYPYGRRSGWGRPRNGGWGGGGIGGFGGGGGFTGGGGGFSGGGSSGSW